jgi:hypothetical protein
LCLRLLLYLMLQPVVAENNIDCITPDYGNGERFALGTNPPASFERACTLYPLVLA